MSLKCRNRSYPKNNNNKKKKNQWTYYNAQKALLQGIIGKKKIRPPITALAKRHNRSWSHLDLLQCLESATIGTA